MSDKHRYQMIPGPTPDEETLLADNDGEGEDQYINGSAIMNGTRAPRRTQLTSIRRAKFQVDNANSYVYQRVNAKGHVQPFYMRYKPNRWYYRPAFVFVASIFSITLLALLFLSPGTERVILNISPDEQIELIPDYERPHVIVTNRLPADARLRPTVANGQLGYGINTNQLSIAGIFNGQQGSSHVARIPLPIEFSIAAPANKSEWIEINRLYSLDSLNGVYTETIVLRNVRLHHSANVSKQVYAHRSYRDLLVVELSLRSEVATDAVDVPLKYANDLKQLSSDDVLFDPTQQDTTVYKFFNACTARGRTLQPEVAGSPVNQVILMWPCLPVQEVKYLWTGGPEVFFVAAGNDFARVNDTFYRHLALSRWLSMTHRAAWNALWASANITVQYKATPPQQNMHTMQRRKRHDMGDIGEGPLKNHAGQQQQQRSSVDKSFQLAQIAYSAQYYLWSEIPIEFSHKDVWLTPNRSRTFKGVSRSGLAHAARTGCYSGHVYWDQEMWMLPTLTALQPQMAQEVLASRVRLLPAARQNAQSMSGSAGARYPWQSGSTGRDVAADDTSLHALHVSCDISAALLNFARSGGNILALSDLVGTSGEKSDSTAIEMAVDIASFWLTRLSCDNDGTKGSQHGNNIRRKRHGDDDDEINDATAHGMEMGSVLPVDPNACHIKNVLGPDQGTSPVDDSYYTNACAFQALMTPSFLCNRSSLNYDPSSDAVGLPFKLFCDASETIRMLQKFESFAARIYMPIGKFNSSWYYHPEFSGYDPAQRNRIMQADAVLASYPLGYRNKTLHATDEFVDDFNRELRRHDLYIYEVLKKPGVGSSALSSSMYSIGFNEFDTQRERALADKYFERQLENVRGPFYIWSEFNRNSVRDFGAVNFLPGVGGFLQSIVNGYAGLRYTHDKHMWLNVGLLPRGVEYAVNGIRYNNVRFNLRVLQRTTTDAVVHSKRRRRKRHGGDDDDEDEHHENMPMLTQGENMPVIVELTWHLPRNYSALMSEWVRHANDSLNQGAPASGEADPDMYDVRVCQSKFQLKNSVLRKRRHGHDGDDESETSHLPTRLIPKDFKKLAASETNGACQLLKERGRVYRFSAEHGGLAVSVSKLAVQRTKRI